jgi:hypothetical protein
LKVYFYNTYIICWWFLFSFDRNGISEIWFEVVVMFTYSCVHDTHTGTHAIYLIHMCTDFQFNCILCSLIFILLPVVCLWIVVFETFPQPETQLYFLQKTVIFIVCMCSMCVIYRIYDTYSEGSLHNSISERTTKQTLTHQYLFLFLSVAHTTCFDPCWVIIRRMMNTSIVNWIVS